MKPVRSQPESVISSSAHDLSFRVARGVLALVCVADILLGLTILCVPRFLFWLFGVSLPEDLLWFQLIGLMLIPTAVDGLAGFRAFGIYRSNVVVSSVSRFATAGFLLVVNSVRSVPLILVFMAIGEGLVGCLSAYYLMRMTRVWRVVTTRAR